MAPFHVQSEVCIAPIHVRSKFVDFSPQGAMQTLLRTWKGEMHTSLRTWSGDIVSGSRKSISANFFKKKLVKVPIFNVFSLKDGIERLNDRVSNSSP